jgi:ATP-dependent Clp protease adaptor protein ClpS
MEPLPEFGSQELDDAGWTATVVPEKKPARKRKRKKKGIPRYNVILWDSDDHTYAYVERMLRELFGHTPEECHKMAETVDTQGKVVVLTTTKEHAELKRDQIQAYGKDELMRNCKGSMYATIESVE